MFCSRQLALVSKTLSTTTKTVALQCGFFRIFWRYLPKHFLVNLSNRQLLARRWTKTTNDANQNKFRKVKRNRKKQKYGSFWKILKTFFMIFVWISNMEGSIAWSVSSSTVDTRILKTGTPFFLLQIIFLKTFWWLC